MARDWLDVGCGTGALTQSILDHADPCAVKGVDASPAFLEHAKARVSDARVHFEVGDAQSLALDAASVDAAVSGLVLNFVPQPLRAASEMARVVRPGGIVAAYVWDYAGRMEMMRYFWDAAVAMDPAAYDLDEGLRFPICSPGPLAELFEQAGLRDVRTRAIDISCAFRDFDDYWSPFLGGQGPAPGYLMSLNDERRAALRELIGVRLPVNDDGSIRLIARAWSVKGLAQ